MQAVILAAGMGSRLGKYTKSSTKCMVKVDGISLIERVFMSLRNVGIKNVVIVTGYCSKKLVDFVNEKKGNLEITYVNNPDYAETNNIYSLWLASEYMCSDDTILFESDLIFDPEIVKNIVEAPYPDVVTVSHFENWMDGTVALFDRKKRITSFDDKSNFSWDETSNYYKTVNIYKLSCTFFKRWYKPFLDAYIKACGYGSYYEMVLKVIANINDSNLMALDITGKKWYEIDTPQDLQIAQTMFGSNRIQDLAFRYGGYWRFPEVVDYAYLVNPWFPNENLKKELSYSFDALLTQYPSGRSVISSLAGTMFDIDAEYITVGNGAAELIRSYMKIIGDYYLYTPTFNEYINSSIHHNFFEPIKTDVCGLYDSIQESLDKRNVIILNPNNPTGEFLTEKEINHILDTTPPDTRVLVDESFADFADKEKRFTLLNEKTLKKHPNLVVVKSISKSYGVPGLRLGVIASSDRELISNINKELPIWNINSFAEYFMQIICKYKKEYIHACNRLAQERNRFYSKLISNKNIEVYPSQANFFMIKLIKNTTDELLEYMIAHNVLIKSLNGKPGMPKGEYIRIAIRTETENDRLVELIEDFFNKKTIYNQ